MISEKSLKADIIITYMSGYGRVWIGNEIYRNPRERNYK
jgi:hypothetical protein